VRRAVDTAILSAARCPALPPTGRRAQSSSPHFGRSRKRASGKALTFLARNGQ